MLAGISLAFEGDVAICLVQITVFDHFNAPLHHIPQIEGNKEHLTLLQGVDVFMVHVHTSQASIPLSGKNNPEKIDGPKGAQRQKSVIDYLHLNWLQGLPVEYHQKGIKKIGCHHDNQSSLTLNLIP